MTLALEIALVTIIILFIATFYMFMVERDRMIFFKNAYESLSKVNDDLIKYCEDTLKRCDELIEYGEDTVIRCDELIETYKKHGDDGK